MIVQMAAPELARKLKGENPPLLIDVREPEEYAFCRIPGAVLKPLGGIMDWVEELDPERETVLHCHSGVRSLQAAYYLQARGFTRLANLRGGIDAWSVLVDPAVPRY